MKLYGKLEKIPSCWLRSSTFIEHNNKIRKSEYKNSIQVGQIMDLAVNF